MILNPYRLTAVIDGDAHNLCRAMTTPPSATRAALIQKTITDLKTAGVWAKLVALQVYAAANAQAALLDWVLLSRAVVANGSLTFTADRGYAGDASAAYVDTGLNPNVTGYSLNDAHLGGWCLGGTSSSTAYLYGQGGASAGRRFMIPNDNLGNCISRVNSNANSTSPGNVGNTGFYLESRTGASTNSIYRAGISLIGLSVASTSITTDNVAICRHGSSYSNLQCAMFTAGAGLTAQNVTDFYNAMLYYMQQVGAA